MLTQIDEFRRLSDRFDDAARQRLRGSPAIEMTQRLWAPSISESRRATPGRSGKRGDEGLHDVLAPAFAEIGHAFDDLFHIRSNLLITILPFLMVTAQ